MLIRIRRLAGSVVGAAFILLLALSMLQMGDAANPLRFFQSSPVVLQVGDEEQRWSTLQANQVGAGALGIVAPKYQTLGQYGPLATAFAFKDGWKNAGLTASTALTIGINQQLLGGSGSGIHPHAEEAIANMTPLRLLSSTVPFSAENERALLPVILQDAALAQLQNSYDFDLVRIALDLSETAEPTEAELIAHLQENEALFQRPPTWAIEGIVYSAADLAATIDVTDDQVRLAYQNNPAAYSTPESWTLQTLTFTTELEATLFLAQLAQDVAFDTALAGSTAQTTPPAAVERAGLSGAQLAFVEANRVGTLSEASVGEDGSRTFTYFAGYTPANAPSFDEVQDQVRRALRLELARENLTQTGRDLRAQARSEGWDLQTLGQENGLTAQTFEGLQTAQTAPALLASAALFANLEINQAPSEDLSIITLIPDEREILFRIVGFEGARANTLDEVREGVTQSWQFAQGVEAAEAKADEALALFGEGATLDAVAAALNSTAVIIQRFEGENALDSRLSETTDTNNFVAILDQSASALLNGSPQNITQFALVNLNPGLRSPFSYADGEAQKIAVGQGLAISSYAVIRARMAEGTPEDEGEDAPSDALLNTILSDEAGQLMGTLATLAYINDVTADVEVTLDGDEIAEQQLLLREAQARVNAQL